MRTTRGGICSARSALCRRFYALQRMDRSAFEFHIARAARDRYGFADRLFSLTGSDRPPRRLHPRRGHAASLPAGDQPPRAPARAQAGRAPLRPPPQWRRPRSCSDPARSMLFRVENAGATRERPPTGRWPVRPDSRGFGVRGSFWPSGVGAQDCFVAAAPCEVAAPFQICGVVPQLKSDHLGINAQNPCGFSDLFAVQILAVQISLLSSALPSKYACVRDAWRPAGTPRNFLSKQEIRSGCRRLGRARPNPLCK
jgi:hypothetical protein